MSSMSLKPLTLKIIVWAHLQYVLKSAHVRTQGCALIEIVFACIHICYCTYRDSVNYYTNFVFKLSICTVPVQKKRTVITVHVIVTTMCSVKFSGITL